MINAPVRDDHLRNGHNDVTMLVDDLGVVVAEYRYDAFGAIAEETGGHGNPYRYGGYLYDAETRLYYLRSRYYDAGLGRFISEDAFWNERNSVYGGDGAPEALAIAQSLNLYVYCTGNPLRYRDPSGRMIYPWDEQNLTQAELDLLRAWGKEYSESKDEKRKQELVEKGKELRANAGLFQQSDSKYTYSVQQQIIALTAAYFAIPTANMKLAQSLRDAYLEKLKALRIANKNQTVSNLPKSAVTAGVTAQEIRDIDAIRKSMPAITNPYKKVYLYPTVWERSTEGRFEFVRPSGTQSYTFFANSYVDIKLDGRAFSSGYQYNVSSMKRESLLVTRKQMMDIGFVGASLSYESIVDLNRSLRKYGITDRNSIALFLATCANETGYGNSLLENGRTGGTRGGGYMQMTTEYIYLKFLEEMGVSAPSDGNYAKLIAENYPWESAAWLWGKAQHDSTVTNLNDYVVKTVAQYNTSQRNNLRKSLLDLYLVTSLYVNFGESRNDINTVIPGITPAERDAIVAGTASYSVSGSVLTVYENPRDAPENWGVTNGQRSTDQNKRINTFYKSMNVFGIR